MDHATPPTPAHVTNDGPTSPRSTSFPEKVSPRAYHTDTDLHVCNFGGSSVNAPPPAISSSTSTTSSSATLTTGSSAWNSGLGLSTGLDAAPSFGTGFDDNSGGMPFRAPLSAPPRASAPWTSDIFDFGAASLHTLEESSGGAELPDTLWTTAGRDLSALLDEGPTTFAPPSVPSSQTMRQAHPVTGDERRPPQRRASVDMGGFLSGVSHTSAGTALSGAGASYGWGGISGTADLDSAFSGLHLDGRGGGAAPSSMPLHQQGHMQVMDNGPMYTHDETLLELQMQQLRLQQQQAARLRQLHIAQQQQHQHQMMAQQQQQQQQQHSIHGPGGYATDGLPLSTSSAAGAAIWSVGPGSAGGGGGGPSTPPRSHVAHAYNDTGLSSPHGGYGGSNDPRGSPRMSGGAHLYLPVDAGFPVSMSGSHSAPVSPFRRGGGGNRAGDAGRGGRRGRRGNRGHDVPQEEFDFEVNQGELQSPRRRRSSNHLEGISRQNSRTFGPEAGLGVSPDAAADIVAVKDIRYLQGRVVSLAADQHGSRLLQQKLEEANPTEVQIVFDESLPHAFELSTDIFGNYLIQKLLQVGTSQQRRQLLGTLRGKVAHLSLQMYGCRVVQRAMEVTSQEERVFMIDEAVEGVHRLVQDQHANHVMQKCIQVASPDHRVRILAALTGRIAAIAVHSYGCRVVQRLLEHCSQSQLTAALEELHSATDRLAYNPYGNYVLQHLLSQGGEDDVHRIATSIHGHVLAMSQHKYASNVVEKCVQYASPGDRYDLILEACTKVENVAVPSPQGIGQVLVSEPALNMMMRDQYANYVVQRMVECAPVPLQHRLFEIIDGQRESLRAFTYGKHIINKVDKMRAAGGGGGGRGGGSRRASSRDLLQS